MPTRPYLSRTWSRGVSDDAVPNDLCSSIACVVTGLGQAAIAAQPGYGSVAASVTAQVDGLGSAGLVEAIAITRSQADVSRIAGRTRGERLKTPQAFRRPRDQPTAVPWKASPRGRFRYRCPMRAEEFRPPAGLDGGFEWVIGMQRKPSGGGIRGRRSVMTEARGPAGRIAGLRSYKLRVNNGTICGSRSIHCVG
jgi:hypothetical protein